VCARARARQVFQQQQQQPAYTDDRPLLKEETDRPSQFP